VVVSAVMPQKTGIEESVGERDASTREGNDALNVMAFS